MCAGHGSSRQPTLTSRSAVRPIPLYTFQFRLTDWFDKTTKCAPDVALLGCTNEYGVKSHKPPAVVCSYPFNTSIYYLKMLQLSRRVSKNVAKKMSPFVVYTRPFKDETTRSGGAESAAAHRPCSRSSGRRAGRGGRLVPSYEQNSPPRLGHRYATGK